MALMFIICGSSLYAEEAKVTGSASIGVFNKYIFRGYELSAGSVVVQPSVGISYKNFSASFWGNIDSDENPTQSFVPDREGQKSFNETDLTLSYTYAIDKLSLTGGYIYYGTKYAAETEELFLTAGYDTLLKPTLSVYRDITEYPGTYVNIAVAHSLPLVRTSHWISARQWGISQVTMITGTHMKALQAVIPARDTRHFMTA